MVEAIEYHLNAFWKLTPLVVGHLRMHYFEG